LPQIVLAQSEPYSRPDIAYYFEDVDEEQWLVYRMKKDTGSYIKLGPHYDNAFGPGVILNYTKINLLTDGSRFGLTTDISGSPQLRTYFDIPLGEKRNYMASFFITGEREKLPIYSDEIDIGNYRRTFFKGGIAFRRYLGINHNLGADLYYRNSSLIPSDKINEVLPGLEYLENFIFRGPELSLVYQLNTYDNQLYPKKGARVQIKYRQAFNTRFITQFDYPDSLNLGNDYKESINPFWQLSVDMESYFRLGDRISINTEFSFGISDEDKPFSENFYLGGYRYNLRENQVAFVGLHSHELLHGNYLKEKLALQLEPVSNLFLTALVNILFVSSDYPKLLKDILSMNDQGRYIGAGAGFTYKTPLGPLSILLGSRTDIWNPVWYLNMGYTF
jgi:NTE family protein